RSEATPRGWGTAAFSEPTGIRSGLPPTGWCTGSLPPDSPSYEATRSTRGCTSRWPAAGREAGSTDAPSPAIADRDDREQERREEDLDADDHARRGQECDTLLGQRAQPVADPGRHDRQPEAETGERHGRSGQQPVLEPDAGGRPFEPRVALAQVI